MLPYRSKKATAKYRARRRLVRKILLDNPACERCDQARATDIHEPKTRARGGNILDEANCCALCHPCHMWIHQHPREAGETGWLMPSWGGTCA